MKTAFPPWVPSARGTYSQRTVVVSFNLPSNSLKDPLKEPAFSLPNSIRTEDWGEKRSLLKTFKGKYIRFHCMGQEIIVWFKQYTNQELGNEMVVDEGL